MRSYCYSEILIMTTGGTIEKSYDEAEGVLQNRDSQLHRILSGLRYPHTKVHHEALFNKDSTDMTDADREVVYQALSQHISKRIPILVIHGTDTMTVTADYCHQRLAHELTAPVIFTGAMKPLGFTDSDATQNVTEALMAAKILPPGIFVSFHGQIFPSFDAEKDRLKRTFRFRSHS